MEKLVKKLLVTTGLIASAAVALLPLTSYAEAVTDTSDPHGVYNCSDAAGSSNPCARADQQEGGPTIVTVNVAPILAIDAVSLTCVTNGDVCVDVDNVDTGEGEEGEDIEATSKAILAYPGLVRRGTLTARVRSAKPFTISISAEDPYLKGQDETGELTGYVIPSSNIIDGTRDGWGIQKQGAADDAYTNITTRPVVFYTSNDPQDDFANFDFRVGVSVRDTTPQGLYSTEVTFTAATIATN